MEVDTKYYPSLRAVKEAAAILKNIAVRTPLQKSTYLSEKYGAEIYLKREDLQVVRSYKIRGAYNKMARLSETERKRGVVCASAGNHAQGVAFACREMGVKGAIFMPQTTPKQKVEQVRWFGGDKVAVHLLGDTFDDAYEQALVYSQVEQMVFVHPFDDPAIIEGQATVGLELIEDMTDTVDYLVFPIGGGGLAAGITSVFKAKSPHTICIGVEPAGAPAMKESIAAGRPIILDTIDKFVDGAAVRQVGRHNFSICEENLAAIKTIDEGKVCSTLIEMYDRMALVVEPAGALSVAALDRLKADIKGKRVVCIISGGNNDITRMEEMKERAIIYQGLKHYFMVNFPQRAGALKEFVMNVLGPNDDITYFEYVRKNARPIGKAIVGIEIQIPTDLNPLIEKMKSGDFFEEYLNENPGRMAFLI
mgnify:CR=1 FL=1